MEHYGQVLPKTDRSRVKRAPTRGAYDRASVYDILDSVPLAHVGYVIDGKPYVTPTLQWREGDRVYWHGSSASRLIRKARGTEVSLAVSELNGYVLARSAFHHSANYRSVMLFGRAEIVADADKESRLKAFVELLYPGRWDTLRPVTEQELKATTVLGMDIAEGSAKIRTGQTKDDAEDVSHPVWAGVIPVTAMAGAPVPAPDMPGGIDVPGHVRNFSLPGAKGRD